MAEERNPQKFTTGQYDKIIRANGRGWIPDKYARMAIYVYLYNRIKGRPNSFELENNDVSFRIRDYIKDHVDELFDKYGVKNIPGVDFSSDAAKNQFLAEIDEYNEHALEINSDMPSIKEMNYFLEEVTNDRRAHFEAIRKSVKWKSGEYSADKTKFSDKNGYLIAERLKKRREIKEQKRLIRREGLWTGVKGLGAIGSIGLTVVSGIALFSPAILGLGPAFAASFLARGVVGIVGAIAGIAGIRSFGGAIAQSFGKLFSLRRKLKDLKDKEGKDRGLKNIEKEIKLNEQVRDIYNKFDKMGKNGALPTEKEFRAYVRRHFPQAYKSDMFDLHQMYGDASFAYSAEKGMMRRVMRFIGHGEVTEIKNEEIPIERDDRYNSIFNKGTGVDASGNMVSMENYRSALRELKDDEDLYKNKHMQKEYHAHEREASQALVHIYDNAIFGEPFSNKRSFENANIAHDELIQERLKNHPDGDKTMYINNALRFVQAEEKLDERNGDKLDSSLGVSIKSQLSRNAEDIEKGCITLGIDETSSDYTTVQDIANDIQNMSVKAQSTNILDKINTSSLPENAKHYLETMVKYRENESKVSPTLLNSSLNYVETDTGIVHDHKKAIISLINSLKKEWHDGTIAMVGTYNGRVYDLNDIKKLIYKECYRDKISGSVIDNETFATIPNPDDYEPSTFLTQTEIENATKLLNDQIVSIENRARNEARANAVDAVRSGAVREDLTDLLDQIQKIHYEDLVDPTKAGEIGSMYATRIVKLAPSEIKDYVVMRLRQRVEEAFIVKISKETAYMPNDGKAIEEIAKDLFIIQGSKYLEQSQKDRLISAIVPKMGMAFDLQFNEMEKYLLVEAEKGGEEFRQKLETYTDRPYSQGGFSNLLGRNSIDSPELHKIKQRIEKIKNGIELQTSLIASAEGVKKVVDANSGETRAILRVFFKKDETARRDNASEFSRQIKAIPNMVANKGLSGLLDNGANSSSVIGDFENYINQIKNNAICPGKPDEQLALLLLVKKNALTVLKAHLKKYITDPNVGHEIDYIKGAGKTNVEGIKKAWEKLCQTLDDEINALSEKNETKYACDGLSFGRATQTLSAAVSSNEMLNYVNSPYSEVGGVEMAR